MKVHRIFSYLLSCTLVLSLAAPVSAVTAVRGNTLAGTESTASGSGTFSDVPSTHWAYDDIEAMTAQGVIEGVGNNLFAPDDKVSLADFALLLTRRFYADELELKKKSLPEDAPWWQAGVETADSAGIRLLNGTSFFSPLNSSPALADEGKVLSPLTRYDMAMILFNLTKAEEWKLTPIVLSDGRTEEHAHGVYAEMMKDYDEIPEEYREAVNLMYVSGVLQGTDAGKFEGDKTMDRAQACAVMKRLYFRFSCYA